MTFPEFFAAIAQIAGLLFVLSSMVAMGLSLTVEQIVAPLKSGRLVALALLANFVLVPLIAALIIWLIPLADGLRVGLVLLATAAGAPFLPKLVQAAEGNVAMGVGLMVLLMVVTVIYMPLVLPLLLPGVAVDAWAIAQSLIVLMLIPLGLALLVRARLPETAATWQPMMNKVSTVSILLLLVTGLALNVANIVGLLGTRGILALLLFIVGSLGVGLALGGREPRDRSVMGLGTAQRNISAAIVVAAQNFTDPQVLVTLLVGAILLLLVLMGAARQLAKRSQTGTVPAMSR
ncbi:MAG: bile acid:sodium symporter family protein [Chloroflexales bacterium]|nr:bile acid:sodium symporter family protein [Chloroflexales bacterium]